MMDILWPLVFLAAWIAVQVWLLPRLGVST
jgi:hypothetical protein